MSEYITDTVIWNFDGEPGETIKHASVDITVKEEIVRCRDCRFYKPKDGAMLSCKFEYHGFTQWKLAEPEGFCAWGERR